MKLILLLFCLFAVSALVLVAKLVVEATTYYTPWTRKTENGIFMPRKL